MFWCGYSEDIFKYIQQHAGKLYLEGNDAIHAAMVMMLSSEGKTCVEHLVTQYYIAMYIYAHYKAEVLKLIAKQATNYV